METTKTAITRVMVAGAGTMGVQVALQCAAHGYEVRLYDAVPAMLDTAPERMRLTGEELVRTELLSREELSAALSRVACTPDLHTAGTEADLVNESIPEDPRLKGRLFGSLNKICPSHCIFTTNTSTLKPSEFAAATGRPKLFLALHFHQPVWSANVADVMPHPGTDPKIVQQVLEFAESIGQIPIELHKESGSYVFNKMLNALLGEAIGIAASGVAGYKDVDRAWMGIMKTGIGPFGIIDLIGIDLVYKITRYWSKKLFFVRRLKRNADYLQSFAESGKLGRKSGQGFYRYPNPEYELETFVSGAQVPGSAPRS